jgi:hypothetical protein
MWRSLGAINIDQYEEQGKVEFDLTLDVTKNRKYSGQYDVETEMKHGIGRNCIKNCGIYEGQWEKDRAHGYGRAINERDLTVYEGYFEDGKENGEGELRKRNGTVRHGLWEDGVFVGGH